jgi:hypothetical protein
MLIGKKLARAAGIVPLAVGLLTVAGHTAAAHASTGCPAGSLVRVPVVIDDPESLGYLEIQGAGLVPRFVPNDVDVATDTVIAGTSPAPNHLVSCGSTVSYWLKTPLTP